MLQKIGDLVVYVVEFDTMPELPITGLTVGEQAYEEMTQRASYPHGTMAMVDALVGRRITYAEALTDAIECGIITEPGKYGIHLGPRRDYEIYKIIE
jgi:hypothetical protein